MDIDVLFAEPSAQVLLHAVDLRISDVTLTVAGSVLQPQSHGYTGQHDLYLVQMAHVVTAGTSARLRLRFAGFILPTLAGFYLSTYTTAAGETRTIASTQFESTDARRAFPCFDEPSFKANFSIALVTEAGKRVLSNMPPTLPDPEPVAPGWQRVQFETSVRMSTYLVAWAITDFVCVEGRTKRGVPVRVWTAPEKLSQTDVALKAGVDALNRYEDFFKVVYPLPKQDMVAIPNFPVGAMENCKQHTRTHRQASLLCNAASQSSSLRSARSPPFLTRCPGVRGPGDLPRVRPAGEQRVARGHDRAERGDDRGARTGAPVVRQPRHHAVVERPLAK